MNGRIVKKLRKYNKRDWFEYLNAIIGWPYIVRLKFALYVINPFRKAKKK